MSSTENINIINIIYAAEAQANTDWANGTYATNIATDPDYYTWKGTKQLIPAGMKGNPEEFADAVCAAAPMANTYRVAFNYYSFDESGNLHPEYTRFLHQLTSNGKKLLFTYADGEIQNVSENLSRGQIIASLNESAERMEESWQKLFDFLKDKDDIKRNAIGYEIVNEPAAYDQLLIAGRSLNDGIEAVELFQSHLGSIAEKILSESDSKIFVPTWGYQGQTIPLTFQMSDSRSIIDAMREIAGDRLVWSVHLYPHWLNDSRAIDRSSLIDFLDSLYNDLGSDSIIVTETNAQNRLTESAIDEQDIADVFIQVFEWFSSAGIGIGWFPGFNTGASSLANVDGNGNIRFHHLSSLAHAMNSFTLGGDFTNENVENSEISYVNAQTEDADSQGVMFFRGGKLSEKERGSNFYNVLMYGNYGNDTLLGGDLDDFLFGQAGNDLLGGGKGNDRIFGGDGNDILRGGSGSNTLFGGAGQDRFIHTGGSTIVVDREFGEEVSVPSSHISWSDVLSNFRRVDVNKNGKGDWYFDLGPDGSLYILDQEGTPTSDLFSTPFKQRDFILKGTMFSDRIEFNDSLAGRKFTARTEAVNGLSGNDTLIGGWSADYLNGGEGNDILRGMAGRDFLSGQRGNDVFFGQGGNDTILGGDGNDTVSGGDGSDTIFLGIGRNLGWAGIGDDSVHIIGGRGSIFCGPGDDTVYSRSSSYLIDLGAGDDILFLNDPSGETMIKGGSGVDSFFFTSGKADAGSRIFVRDFDGDSDRIFVNGRSVNWNGGDGYSVSSTDHGFVLEIGDNVDVLLF